MWDKSLDNYKNKVVAHSVVEDVPIPRQPSILVVPNVACAPVYTNKKEVECVDP